MPMKDKRKGQRALARECWTRQWEKELTLPEVIHCSIVLFSYKLPSHRKSGPPATHVIPEASAVAAMAMLAFHGVVVDADEEWETEAPSHCGRPKAFLVLAASQHLKKMNQQFCTGLPYILQDSSLHM